MKKLACILAACLVAASFVFAGAAPKTHIVKSGDSIWRIASQYQIGVSELLKANPQIKNAAMINVGDRITIPDAAPLQTLEQEVGRLVNAERAKYGLAPLKYNWEVARIARMKSQDMIDRKYFSHQSPSYGSPFNMMESFGIRFSAGAENIAMGQATPADVMRSWMNSAGHKANILSKQTTHIGVGAAKSANGTLYWTQMFIKPM